MSRVSKVLLATFLITVLGCSSGSSTSDPSFCDQADPFVGDRTLDPEFTLLTFNQANEVVPLIDNGTVDLISRLFGLQGGTLAAVVFAGVRATNLNPCGVLLSATFEDEATGHTRLDARSVNLVPQEDGFAETVNSATFTNVPACPNQWSSRNINDESYLLSLELEDADGRTASTSIHVTPICEEGSTRCPCICAHGYVLGQVCN